MPHPELSVAIKGGIIAITFLASYFQQEANSWNQFIGALSDWDFLLAWGVSGSINVAANFLMIIGMKRGKISDTVPFLSLSPVFLLASGYVFLGETMNWTGVIGVATVALGGLWLSRASAGDGEAKSKAQCASESEVVGLSYSIARLRLPPGADLYILIALIQSISSAFDKRGVRAAGSPMLYGGIISWTVSFSSLVKFLWLSRCRVKGKVDKGSMKGESDSLNSVRCDIVAQILPSLALISIACALKMSAYWCQLKANELIYSAQLSAIRKSGTLMVLLLGRVVFKEEVASKWLPVSTMLIGVGLLAAI
jgi:drug/metabolite transporter (DMT)-like permease